MGKYDNIDTSKMDPATRRLFEMGSSLEKSGDSIHKASESLSDAGHSLTMGCTIPILIGGVLLILLWMLFL